MGKNTVQKEIKLLKALIINAEDICEEVCNKVNKVKEHIAIEEVMATMPPGKNIEITVKKINSLRKELEKELYSLHDIRCLITDINKKIVGLEDNVFDSMESWIQCKY
ncbi:MAG TPA: hypothetical protein VMT12_03425 [Syntrophales bacterium]|nr:hypothetical protein [Syntrophales bacterium]